jgi:DNA-binding NarL/FixJ family response regulator
MFRRRRVLIAHCGKYFGNSMWSKFIPEPEFDIVGLAGDIDEAVNMASSLFPDFILVDLSDAETLGLRTIHTLSAVYPYIPIIAYLPNCSNETSRSALNAGAIKCLTETDRVVDIPLQPRQGAPARPTRPKIY